VEIGERHDILSCVEILYIWCVLIRRSLKCCGGRVERNRKGERVYDNEYWTVLKSSTWCFDSTSFD
jgi:hypothetical protein